MSKWYYSFVLSLKWDCITNGNHEAMHTKNNLFQQMTLLQYWVNWFWFWFSPSHMTWVFCIAPWTFEHRDIILIHDLRQINNRLFKKKWSINLYSCYLSNPPSIFQSYCLMQYSFSKAWGEAKAILP